MTRAGLLAFATALLVAMAIDTAPSGHADRGVGVDVASLEVETKLEPGRGYFLPPIGVLNSGDEITVYELSVTYIADQTQRRPERTWFDFQPERFALGPGESQAVTVGITVPASAAAGEYFALVRAQTVAAQTGGTSVGVAAATKLSFSVEPSSWLDAQRRQVNRWLYEGAPWTYVLPAGLLLAFLATRAGKLPFRLRVERK